MDVEPDLREVLGQLNARASAPVKVGPGPALFVEGVQLIEGVEVTLDIVAPAWDLLIERAYQALNAFNLWAATEARQGTA
ncbi:hypothetical protein KKF91_14185 [Myxococcota bacterium]|nr:hypothetical protein [Myxococcota bacterium]